MTRPPVGLCDLNNPRRLRRSWVHRDRFHDDVDDLNLEKAMRRRKHLKSRRNCGMMTLSREQEDRIVSRITARNPGTRKGDAYRWLRKLPASRRLKIIRSVLGKMNPGRPAKYRDQGSRYRNNPKRDGTPTRGEKRRVKYVDYLKSVIGKSEDARLEYQRLTATVAKAGAEIHKPVGPRAMRHAVKEHVESWKARHEAELEAAHAPPAPPAAAEHPELKFVRNSLSDLESAIAHFQKEIKELPDDDLKEDEEARLHEEIGKLARQKKVLREKLADLQPAMSNPRGRRSRRRRLSRSTLSAIKRAGDRCARALRSLRSALRRH